MDVHLVSLTLLLSLGRRPAAQFSSEPSLLSGVLWKMRHVYKAQIPTVPESRAALQQHSAEGWFKTEPLMVIEVLAGTIRRCSGLRARLLRTEPAGSA